MYSVEIGYHMVKKGGMKKAEMANKKPIKAKTAKIVKKMAIKTKAMKDKKSRPKITIKSKASAKIVKKAKISPNAAMVNKPFKNTKSVKQPAGKATKITPIDKLSKLAAVDITSYQITKSKKLKNMNISKPEDVKNAINIMLCNENIVDYLKKNVSRVAPEVIGMLSTPRTDEYIAAQLDLKINAIRRILNILQGYGITNYYVAKNTNGWLSFAWFINVEKLDPFLQYVNGIGMNKSIINADCNDYFMCKKCYPVDKMMFTFDSAFETGFKCSCGNELHRISKAEAEELIKPVVVERPIDIESKTPAAGMEE